jgi:N-acyl-D-amino-acid deacylase
LDILIRNGFLVDGTGNPRRKGDIGIEGDRIIAVGNLKDQKAKRVIEASGKLVCPGFIDAHSHSDVTVECNPYFESTIRQGITTEIVGNCGDSTAPFPMSGGGGFGRFGNAPIPHGRTLGEHMKVLEDKGMSANLAWLVGHNTIRKGAGVSGSSVSEEQYRKMESILISALEDGALGMSSGLEFEPGRTCRPEEIHRLAKVLARYDAIYTSHIRNRDSKVLEAVDEFLDVIRTHGIRGEISHMNIRHNTKAPENAINLCIRKIKEARKEGFDVLTDMTPLNYGIGQMSGILPEWLTNSPPDQLGSLLKDPEVRARLRTDCDRYWRFIAAGEWNRVRMQSNGAFPEINGLSFVEISKMWSKDPWDCYFDILAAEAPDIGNAVLVAYLFTDEHLRETIPNPLYMLVVDGYSTSAEGELAGHTMFPLHYIGMAWFLTHHVRECGLMSLEEAVRKMTSMPATHFRLNKRGLLCEGYYADMCIFDFDKLETPFDLARPAQYTKGMDYVIVNGQLVLDQGVHTHATPGRNIKRIR